MSGVSRSTRSKTRNLAAAIAAAAFGNRRSSSSPPARSGGTSSPSSPNPQSTSPLLPTSPASAAAAAENKCAICLSGVVNKCKTDSCRHEFCFGCLLEWSKIKAECPLCKTPILKISHNFRTDTHGQESSDEYHVPPSDNEYFVPPPTLSIRLAARFGSGPPLAHSSSMPFRRGFEDFMESLIRFSPDPFARISSTAGDLAAGPSTAHHHHRDRHTDAGFFRILEVGPMSAESRAMNAFLSSGDDGFENPFYSSEDLDFGGDRGEGRQGFQARRRIYDRQQWVAPFQSTLQPGTVFFPSVEYFRTHPTAYGRIKPWLKRELIVLIGLTTPRPNMAALYDVILSLLLRFDIRSREFRDMIRIYFSSSDVVKHFQHEFYHFVLSGLRMEGYDSTAVYANSRANSTVTVSNPCEVRPTRPSAPAPVPIITIDSDEDHSAFVDLDQQPGPSSRARQSRHSRKSKSRRGHKQRGRQPQQQQPQSIEEQSHFPEFVSRPPRRSRRISNTSSEDRSNNLRARLRRSSNGFWSAIDLSTATTSAAAVQAAPPPPSLSPLHWQRELTDILSRVENENTSTNATNANANATTNNNESDNEDCLLLGIHPIVKPPPLAVITIDSDDEVNVEDGAATTALAHKNPDENAVVPLEIAEAEESDNDISITSITLRPFQPEPKKLKELTANPHVFEIDDSSSSVHILEERPASPKPSTSAAARERLRFRIEPKKGVVKKSDFLLSRMLEDLEKNEQENVKRKWDDEDSDEELFDLDEETPNNENNKKTGHKIRRISSASSTISRSSTSSSLRSFTQLQNKNKSTPEEESLEPYVSSSITPAAVDLSRNTGPSPASSSSFPSSSSTPTAFPSRSYDLHSLLKTESAEQRRWESDNEQAPNQFEVEVESKDQTYSSNFVQFSSSSSSSSSSGEEDSAGLLRPEKCSSRRRNSEDADAASRLTRGFLFGSDVIDFSAQASGNVDLYESLFDFSD